MIRFILIPLSIMLGCASTKTNQPVANTETVEVNNTKSTGGQDSINKNLTGKMLSVEPDIPSCIKSKIDSFKLKEVHEKPQRVTEYSYKGKKVYYVVMACCDFFNEVYDDKCNFMGSPDGGFTGQGDGKLPDFFKETTAERLIWGKAD